MASPTEHKCCVCGQPASSRCSSCGKVGVNLPFCGVKHQRLVYPAHKRFCGQKPLLLPPLEEDELAVAREHRDVVQYATAELVDALFDYPMSTERFLLYLSSPPATNDRWRWLSLLVVVRKGVSGLASSVPLPAPDLKATVLGLTHFTGELTRVLADDAAHNNDGTLEQVWWLELHHRMLVIIALLELLLLHDYRRRSTPEVDNLRRYLRAATGTTCEWVEAHRGVIPAGVVQSCMEQLQADLI
ncbi:hypothetical protein JCM8097_007990 [Rhodosporidiobolus ruineniae]